MLLWQKAPAGEESFEALRERLFGNVLTLLAILTSLGLLILLLRVRLIGWQPFMVVQLISLGGIAGLAFLRPLGVRRRLLWLTGLMMLFVTSSTLQLGPAADSRGFLLFLAFLIGFFLTPRAAVSYSLLLLLWATSLGSWAYFQGLPLALNDYPAYAANPSTWISVATVLCVFSAIIGYVGATVLQHLRAQAEAIRHSETRMRGLFELSPIGITLNDLQEGRFLEVNPALLQMTGYDRQGFRALEYWQLTPREYLPQEKLQRARLLAEGRYGPYEKELIRQDGTRLPVRVQGMLVTDSEGRQCVWSMVQDIRDEQRLGRMQREFVSTVSHELRTPLTSISGALGLINGGVLGEIPDPAREMVALALQNSQQLTFLVNDLLDMEKLLAGKMTFDLQVQRLLPLVERVLAGIRGYAEQHQVTCVLRSASDAWVNVDAQRLEQVLNNLLSNAAKFSPPGAEVEVLIERQDAWVRVRVRDRGPGIAEAFRSRIFEQFAQADSSDTREKGGTGMGLAISRQLMERMEGRIGFDSLEGQGSTFYFELPCTY